MKRIIAIMLFLGVFATAVAPVYASDWDKAGKALTIIEGLRILTGGRVDFIGNIAGINRNAEYARETHHDYYVKEEIRRHHPRRVWVPHFVWKRKYIPRHEEYIRGRGLVIIEAHYIEYRVEEGGHWETVYDCD